MTKPAEIIGPASETYAGFAWDYLRRNETYVRHYQTITSEILPRFKGAQRLMLRAETPADGQARKWGLECFETPSVDALDAQVFWRQDAFPGALTIQYHAAGASKSDSDKFNLANLDCSKLHLLKSDGTRITVLKSETFWLQIAGVPSDPLSEDECFSVMIDGGKGSRRRIDALRQLTSLSRDGVDDFKLLGRQKAFAKLRNALVSHDIRAAGGSYKDVAIALFGVERVEQEWESAGGFLKARARRSCQFALRMIEQDYQSLLPKKTI